MDAYAGFNDAVPAGSDGGGGRDVAGPDTEDEGADGYLDVGAGGAAAADAAADVRHQTPGMRARSGSVYAGFGSDATDA